MSEKIFDDSVDVLKSRIDTKAVQTQTSGIEADAVDVQTKQISSDVPIIPRLEPESVATAVKQTTEGLDAVKGTAPAIFGMADQEKSLMAYPDPQAKTAMNELTIQELVVETDRTKAGVRERFYQDRARDSAVAGWGDDTIPQTMYAKDESQERLAAPTEQQANIDVAMPPDKPSSTPKALTLSGMFEGMNQVIMNLQNQFAIAAEALVKGFEATQKKIRSQSFLTPDEEG